MLKKLESQEHDKLKFSSKCEEVTYSEEYFDIVVGEYENIQEIIERYNAECYQIIGDIYVIISVPVDKYGDFIEDLSAVEIPIIFGPYSKRSIEPGKLYAPQRNIPLRGKGVLVGIVDSGIDYNHQVFINEDGTTKILRIWDQTIPGNPPDGFHFGTEYTEEDINEALKTENPYDIVPSKDISGHGTFLAGVAAGREVLEENFVGVAPEAELVVVKLKEAKKIIKEFYFVEDINEVYQNSDIIQGMNYLMNIAKGFNRPLVICLGLGNNLGAHDGSGRVEHFILNNAKTSGYVFIAPSGNEAVAGHHYKGTFASNENAKDVKINIAEGEKGIYFNIWCHAPDKINISMITPFGGFVERVPLKFSYAKKINLAIEQTNISIIYKLIETLTGDQFIFVRMENPVSGIWTLTVYGEVIVNGSFDIWLPRVGWVKDETKFLQPDPFTTVTMPGTVISALTVGGYNQETDSIYESSGLGLVWDDELKPDVVAPSVNVYGPLPGNTFGTMTGTSIASAITGGASALLLEWGILLNNYSEMDTFVVKDLLIRGAKRKSNLIYPNRIWGYGQLDIIRTYELLQGLE